MLAGVPRRLALLNGTAFAAVTFGLHSLWCIPIFLAVHVAGIVLAKRDPYFLEVIVRHLRHRPFYGV
jgi:type IV secretion system protein TrbD